MPACLAWQGSVHPAPGQELVYPGGARLNTRGGRSSATLEWARSQICSIASGVPASSLRGQLYTFQALPPEGCSGSQRHCLAACVHLQRPLSSLLPDIIVMQATFEPDICRDQLQVLTRCFCRLPWLVDPPLLRFSSPTCTAAVPQSCHSMPVTQHAGGVCMHLQAAAPAGAAACCP